MRRLRKTEEKRRWALAVMSRCAGSTNRESQPLPLLLAAATMPWSLRAFGGRSYGVAWVVLLNGRFRNLPPAPNPPSEAASHGFPSRAVSMRERETDRRTERVKARVRNLGIEVERESEESAN